MPKSLQRFARRRFEKGSRFEKLRTCHKCEIMDRLIKLRTRDTLDRTENQFGEFSFLSAPSQEKQRLLRSSPSINYPINQRRRRRRMRIRRHSQLPTIGERSQKHRDFRERERRRECYTSPFYFSLSLLLFPQVQLVNRK